MLNWSHELLLDGFNWPLYNWIQLLLSGFWHLWNFKFTDFGHFIGAKHKCASVGQVQVDCVRSLVSLFGGCLEPLLMGVIESAVASELLGVGLH